MTETLAPVAVALHLAKAGWSVFPSKSDKTPVVKWTTASTTEVKMSHSWEGRVDHNIGVEFGAPGLVVIDQDHTGAVTELCRSYSQELPPTYTASTRTRARDGGHSPRRMASVIDLVPECVVTGILRWSPADGTAVALAFQQGRPPLHRLAHLCAFLSALTGAVA